MRPRFSLSPSVWRHHRAWLLTGLFLRTPTTSICSCCVLWQWTCLAQVTFAAFLSTLAFSPSSVVFPKPSRGWHNYYLQRGTHPSLNLSTPSSHKSLCLLERETSLTRHCHWPTVYNIASGDAAAHLCTVVTCYMRRCHCDHQFI